MAEHDGGHHEMIIIKRHEEDEHEAHSSAWKVAHADFMTAMMAFFLVMWLINVTDENVRKGISEYFNPVHLSSGQAEQKGLTDPHVADPEAEPGNKSGVPETPKDAKPADKPATAAKTNEKPDPKAKPAKAAAKPEEKAAAEPKGKAEAKPAANAAEKAAASSGASPAVAAAAGIAASSEGDAKELSAIADPYAVLAKIRAEERPNAASAALIVGDERKSGMLGVTERDPFDPTYWQTAPTAVLRLNGTLTNPAIETPPKDMKIDAAAAMPREATEQAKPADAKPAEVNPLDAKPSESKAIDAAALKAQDAAKPVELAKLPDSDVKPESADKQVAALEAKATTLRNELTEAIRAAVGNADAPTLKVEATPEGLLVNLTDDSDFAMFAVGSAIPNQRLVKIMDEVGKALARQKGTVVIRGHTDGRPFRSEVYDNWRLSSARAQMAHYMLVHGGLEDRRIVAIEGYADRNLKNRGNSYAAENRRIEILIKDAGK